MALNRVAFTAQELRADPQERAPGALYAAAGRRYNRLPRLLFASLAVHLCLLACLGMVETAPPSTPLPQAIDVELVTEPPKLHELKIDIKKDERAKTEETKESQAKAQENFKQENLKQENAKQEKLKEEEAQQEAAKQQETKQQEAKQEAAKQEAAKSAEKASLPPAPSKPPPLPQGQQAEAKPPAPPPPLAVSPPQEAPKPATAAPPQAQPAVAPKPPLAEPKPPLAEARSSAANGSPSPPAEAKPSSLPFQRPAPPSPSEPEQPPAPPPATASQQASGEALLRQALGTDVPTEVRDPSLAPPPNDAPGGPTAAAPLPTDNDPLKAIAVPSPMQGGDEIVSYKTLVFSKLELAKKFPEEAKKRHAHGAASIAFVLDDKGQVTGVTLIQSSGDPALDAESQALVMRAAPFPPPPAGAQRAFGAVIEFGSGSR